MAMPGSKVLVEAIREYLTTHAAREVSSEEVEQSMRKKFKVTEADLAARTPSIARANGESAWKLRLRRAKFNLIQAGVVVKGAGRGVWKVVGDDGSGQRG